MIYTGRFVEIENYERIGFVPVSIAGEAPDYYKGIQFKTLAPKYSWWKEWHDKHLSNEWYEKKYKETVLDRLNPKVIANRLQEFGQNVILLCYEEPDEFCHRQLVANWLRAADVTVYEYSTRIGKNYLNRGR